MENLNLLPSLNYAQLTTLLCVVAVLLMFTLILLAHTINNLIDKNRALEENLENYKDAIHQKFVKHFDAIEDANSSTQRNYQRFVALNEELETLKQSLIKPKFNVGDKVKTRSIKSGTIIEIFKQEEEGFKYLIEPRSYFGREVKNDWASEAEITKIK